MSIVLYGQFLVTAIYIGFSSGAAPVISYNYGKQNKKQTRKIIKYSAILYSYKCYIFIYNIYAIGIKHS